MSFVAVFAVEERFLKWKKPVIRHGKLTKYNWLVLYPEGLDLGEKTDIGAFTLIHAKNGVVIEKNAQIGSHCSIYSESTIDGKKGRVVIKENALIGTHSTIMPGVTIGKNAVVAAHSFVKTNVPDGEVWGGVPARPLGRRRKRVSA